MKLRHVGSMNNDLYLEHNSSNIVDDLFILICVNSEQDGGAAAEWS